MILKYISTGMMMAIIKMTSSLWLFSIVSSYLSPSLYAPYAAVSIIIGLFTTVGGIGIAPAIVRMSIANEGKISAYIILSILLGLVVTFFTCVFSENLAIAFNLSNGGVYFIIASPVILIKIVSFIFEAVLQREMKLNIILGTDFVSYLIFHVLLQCVFLYYKLPVYFLIFTLVLEELLKLVIYLSYFKLSFIIKPDFSNIKNDMLFSSSVTFNRVLNYISSQADKFYVANKISAIDFAGYSRVFQFCSYPINIVGQVFDKVVYPYICKRERERNNTRHLLVISMLAVSGFFIVAICYLLNGFVKEYFLKDEWSIYISVYYIALMTIPVRLVDRYCAIVLNAINKPHYRSISQILFLCSLLFGLFFVKLDVYTIAMVYVISYSISAVSSVAFLYFLKSN